MLNNNTAINAAIHRAIDGVFERFEQAQKNNRDQNLELKSLAVTITGHEWNKTQRVNARATLALKVFADAPVLPND
jgi:acetamidase/formamidase